MSADPMDVRVRDLERGMASLATKVDELGKDVHSLSTVAESTARLDERMTGVQRDVQNARKSIGEVRTLLEARDQQTSDERRSIRVAILSLVGVIAAALIAGAATVLVAVIA